MHRGSANVLSLAILAVLACPALAAEREIERPFDEVWRSTVQLLTSLSLEITVNDPAGGVLKAVGRTVAPDWMVCEKGRGIFETHQVRFIAMLNSTPSGATAVRITLEARAAWYTRTRFMWQETRRAYNYVECQSTGFVEEQLLEQIAS